MPGRTWKNVNSDVIEKIKKYLIKEGGVEEQVKSAHEVWRIKFSDATFTYYKKETLFSTPSNALDPAVFEAWEQINMLRGSAYASPTKDFLIGFDETGKGEVIGHTVLTGVIFPKEVFHSVDLIVGPADTKKRHTFEYWDGIFRNLDNLRNEGFDFITEKIPPWHVDRYNLNKIMDVTYQRILSVFLRKIEFNRCRIVLDNYGIGAILGRFINFIRQQGAEVVVLSNAEDTYLEVKAASLVSKRTREEVMKRINEDREFQINDLSIGSGNAGDKRTSEWLKSWHASGKKWPWFVKKSFKTVWQLENKTEKPHKENPPVNEKLLSEDFVDAFNKGRLSIQALSVVCPKCGSDLKSVTFAIFKEGIYGVSKLKCSNSDCNEFIEDVGFTLNYYCGFVVPDSSVIRRSLISNDLNASKIFENFTVILSPVVRKECDGTNRGKIEFSKLRKYHNIGRIKLESVGKVADIKDGISGTERDEKIIETCLEYNAILLTADNSMSTFAIGRNVFTIFI